MDCAFDWGMDTSSSHRVSLEQMERFLKRFDFSGNPRALFTYLDVNQNGFLTVSDLDFLAKWQGEKKVKSTASFDFNAARLWLPSNKKPRWPRRMPVTL